MHELSIAMNIVKTVSGEAEKRGAASVSAVTLRIGELSGVDKRALAFAWDVATTGSPAAGSRLEFEEIPLVVSCPACGVERRPESTWQLSCPTCPGAMPAIVSGRELHIVSMEIPE